MILSKIIYFVLTFVIEFFVVYFFIRKDYLKVLFYVFLINLFTWPLANLFYGFGANFYFIEFCVFLAESVLIMLLFQVKYKKALLISFIANLLTASAGLVLSLFVS